MIVVGPNKDRVIDGLVMECEGVYRACIPHTTRPPRDDEVNAHDYFFVSEQAMHDLIAKGIAWLTLRRLIPLISYQLDLLTDLQQTRLPRFSHINPTYTALRLAPSGTSGLVYVCDALCRAVFGYNQSIFVIHFE